MPIIDAHLDLAYNALRGREVLRTAWEQKADEEGIPTVGLPDLREAGAALICATIFCEPDLGKGIGYHDAVEAHAMGIAQLRWYEQQFASGELALVRSAGDLPVVSDGTPQVARSIPTILLIEGADPIKSPDELATWFDAGVRMIGLAWKRTRYAGGTGAPGPLTAEGVELVRAMDALGMIHDVSHLAEESFWQLLDQTAGPVVATHSNCRAIIPTDRQLSDEMIRALIDRGGVIGINFFDRFLIPPGEHGKRRANLADVVRHMRHICDIAGNTHHVAIGTDMDGGLGREQIPQEISTSADLPRLASALSAGGFGPADIDSILWGNWLRFFSAHLPK